MPVPGVALRLTPRFFGHLFGGRALLHPASGVPEVLGLFAFPGWRFAYPALLRVTPFGVRL